MKKKLLSIVVAGLLAVTVVPEVTASATETSVGKPPIEGIRYDPNSPTHVIACDTKLYSKPDESSLAIYFLHEGEGIFAQGTYTDSNNVEWTKVEVRMNKYFKLHGYVKTSDLAVIYY